MDKQIQEIIERQQKYEFLKQLSLSEEALLPEHKKKQSGMQSASNDSFLQSEIYPKSGIYSAKHKIFIAFAKLLHMLGILILILLILLFLVLYLVFIFFPA